MAKRRQFIAGNWKMNKTVSESRELAEKLRAMLDGFDAADIAVCPTFVALAAVADALRGSRIAVGAQNLYWKESGAFTGEISGPMLVAVGCRYAIVGHSERRQYFGETDETVGRRAAAALACGLHPIVCLGETLDERRKGATFDVVRRQMQGAFSGIGPEAIGRVTIAYEPVWAIGTGVNATPEQAQEVHGFLRGLLTEKYGAAAAEALRIQYGGSVKPENARDLLSQPDIDGALVGGASLKAEDFAAIVRSCRL
ncbi:MAG: triose-phosphate isomerase [Planctomycetota bacterium]|nr:triose-phosphate isomerase [Planctomycetota bacterium]